MQNKYITEYRNVVLLSQTYNSYVPPSGDQYKKTMELLCVTLQMKSTQRNVPCNISNVYYRLFPN